MLNNIVNNRHVLGRIRLLLKLLHQLYFSENLQTFVLKFVKVAYSFYGNIAGELVVKSLDDGTKCSFSFWFFDSEAAIFGDGLPL